MQAIRRNNLILRLFLINLGGGTAHQTKAKNAETVLASEFVSGFVSLTRIAKIIDFRDPKNAGHFYDVTSVTRCRRDLSEQEFANSRMPQPTEGKV